MSTLRERLAEHFPAVFQKDGVLTRDLVLSPARFGLGRVPERVQPDATTTSVCGYCSTGCGLNLHLRDGRAVNLTPTVDYPVNQGMACPKGWEALTPLRASDRGTTPLLRVDGQLRPVPWHEAARHFAARFQAIQARHGQHSVAFLSTGQIPTEEMVVLGTFAKFGMGLRHGDGNTRQCMATSVVAYKESFGFDAPPYTYDDLEQSDVLVFIGSNLCIGHPILWQRVLQNPHDPRIVVVDPRRTETAQAASPHLPLAPKSDLTLLYAVARLLIENDWVDRRFIAQHTSGFDAFARHVAPFSLEAASRETGLSPDAIERFARAIHEGRRVSFWWTMGVNQSYEGVRTAQAIINLALMTGNVGRPGTGANSITGQCNAMGSRLFSNTTNLFGGRDFQNAADRQDVARTLKIPVERIPDQPSWDYARILEGIDRGEIRGLWVICTNPAHSWIHQGRARELLDKLEFLVVQDMYSTTETAQHADLFLPAAGWGEKEGTFINSERRIGLLKKVSPAPGEALADFAIFKLLAHYWGCPELLAGWNCPEDVFESIKKLSEGRPCDLSGIRDYQLLDTHGGLQWPCTQDDFRRLMNGQLDSQRRLFEDGTFYHDDGKARFIAEAPRPMPEPVCPDYPYLLLTGRGSAAQWHTQTRTGKSPVLRKLAAAEIYVEIHPADARRLGIENDEWVEVASRRGTLRARAVVSPAIQRSMLFIPMHYAATNQLTLAHFDPYSKQPSYKDCAVALRRVTPSDPSEPAAKLTASPSFPPR